jgi:transglutaminase-like putative cysteine protease
VEVYVPGAGWITFDPTNQKVGSGHLIPIAVGRKISQVMPVSGNFFGPRNAFLGMNVLVDVRD